MNKILRRLSLAILENDQGNASWKDPYSPDYDRQYAENVLYNTIGPLTENPRYVSEWKGNSTPPPGFKPGGQSPRWTQEEVSIAFAGDPATLFSRKSSPRSPKGSPLYRWATSVAKRYGQDPMDLYQNGFTLLAKLMQPGYDEGRSPFISWVSRSIKGAVEHGIGGSLENIKALGGEASKTIGGQKVTTGQRGIDALLKAKTPKIAKDIANQVKGKYQTTKSHDKNPDNPFGAFSSRFYEVAMNYADALESGDNDRLEAAQNRIEQLRTDIEEAQTPIRGASTGAGEAVSTTSRKHSESYKWTNTGDGPVWAKVQYKKMPNGKVKELVDPGVINKDLPPGEYEGEVRKIRTSKGVTSLDVEDPTTGKKQDLEDFGGASRLYGATMDDDPSQTMSIAGIQEAEGVYNLLQLALNTDLGFAISKSPRLQKIARDHIAANREMFSKQLDSKTGELKTDLDIGGRLTTNEFRFALRHLGPLASDYPGRGKVRANTSVPRGANNWWKPGEDPEIEPIPGGGMWESIWLREGTPASGADDIQKEMNQEYQELIKLGIAVKSNVPVADKKSEYVDPKTGQLRDIAKKSTDVLSKSAISAAKTKAIAKLTLLAKFLALEESTFYSHDPILESTDPIDRKILAEAARKIMGSLMRALRESHKRRQIYIPNSYISTVTSVVTMPSTEAMSILREHMDKHQIQQCCGREAIIKISSTDVPSFNIAASVACEDAGYDSDQYMLTIGSIARGRYSGKQGYNILKNVGR
jgi:hypothetical protein